MSELAIVQARLGSSRLPGKVLQHIGGKPCLWHVMERVKLAGFPYILTIPDAPSDDALARYAEEQGWPVSRGPEHDLLARFGKAWVDAGSKAAFLVRVTADCPFVQPRDIQRLMGAMSYTSNAHPVRQCPKGLDVEAFSVDLLLRASLLADDPEDRQHVTPWMRRDAGLATSTDDGEFRVTLDTPEDLSNLREIARWIPTRPPHPTLAELRDYYFAD